MADLVFGSTPCHCVLAAHQPKLVALTGGPGAGKTAVLEMARRTFCEHVAILPESAGIVFGGGFPRRVSDAARRAAQRAIFHVQREVESLVLEEARVAVILCDRGTLDGAAYWPGPPDELFAAVETSADAERSRYAAVVHLRTPPERQGYNHTNVLRIETAAEAARIDARIAEVWHDHPHRFEVGSADDFVSKAKLALSLIGDQLPECCHAHKLMRSSEP